MTPLDSRRPFARALAAVAATTLAAVGVATVTAPAAGAALLQPAGVSVSVVGGQAYTSTAIKADFVVTNRATNGASLAAFTLVVPPGVGRVTSAGVSGPGNWAQTVVPCGSVTSCSSLVVVFGTLPLRTSLIRPGQSVLTSIRFTTSATPGPIAFRMIGIGGGIFTTTDTPTINVISGDAKSFLVSGPGSTVTAGGTGSFGVQALNLLDAPAAYAGGQVKVELGSDDPGAVLHVGATAVPFVATPVLPSGTKSTAVVTLPPSVGTAPIPITIGFTRSATAQTVSVTETKPEPNATGTSAGFAVGAAAPTAIVFESIADASTGPTDPALPNPAKTQDLVATFHVEDQFGNFATVGPGVVTLTAGGPGVLTTQPASGADPNTPGTILGVYSEYSPSVVFTLSLGATDTEVRTSPVDTVGASAVFTPGTAGTLGTTNFVAPNADGSSNCDLTPTDPVCSFANLPEGANGHVDLTQQVCVGLDTINGVCATHPNLPIITYLKGDFTDGAADLYTRTAPASVVITCLNAVCPHQDESFTGVEDVTYPDWHESAEDFLDYPLFAQPSGPGVDTSVWFQVPACQTAPITSTPQGSSHVIPVTSDFCVDVTSIVRNTEHTGSIDDHDHGGPGDDHCPFVPGPHYGDLSFTLYFIGDPRAHP